MDNSIQKNNRELLLEKHPLLHRALTDCNADNFIQAIESKKGDFVPQVTLDGEGKKIFIHSKFDPFKEAARFVSEVDPEQHDLYIVLGFGFAYHIEELLKKIGPGSILLAIEKFPAMVKEALAHRDLRTILADERVHILVNPNEDLIAETMKGKSSRRVSFISHRGSYQADPEYYNNLLEKARSYLSTKEVNIATLAKFEKIWSSNIARNIGAFAASPGANIFYDMFKDMPALVVAAGPTLLHSLEFIRKNRERMIIVAVDTAYGVLLHHGIEPHFCIAVDPQVINARYFEGTREGKTILVADPTVHPSVYRLFRGRVVCTGVAFKLMKWIERIFGERGELTHGGSVSTNAYDFALRLGAKPIIMVGQDLSFTNGQAHARGSYLDEQIHLKTNRVNTVDMFNRRQLTALPKIFVKGIRTPQVHTNQKMMIFLSWFEKRKDSNLINATHDGAYITGVAHRDCSDLEGEFSGESNPDRGSTISALIDEIYSAQAAHSEKKGAEGSTHERLVKRVGLMLDEIESLIPVLERGIEYSDNLLAMMKEEKEKRDRGKVDYTLRKLSEADAVIESKETIKDVISFTIQRVIHTITEGYEIDDADSSLSEDELVAKKSGFLYRGLLEGALFNKKILGKMKSLLV
ncbi:MAG: motility associated factor glycosyltransferase family protein [bacterium]|nr:motility associated factor glycosyltransferase family protein [bacterium]